MDGLINKEGVESGSKRKPHTYGTLMVPRMH